MHASEAGSLVTNQIDARRFEAEKKEHGRIQKELDAANERFKEYERKDVKLREDIKHLQAKQKKLADKRAKDSAKAQARHLIPPKPLERLLRQTAFCDTG